MGDTDKTDDPSEGGPLTLAQFLSELEVPEGLTADDLKPAAALVREWAEGDDPEVDPTAPLVVAKIYEMLAASDKTRKPKA